MNLLLEMLEVAKSVYDNDVMTYTQYGSDTISDQMLDGEYKVLRKLERYVDQKIKEQEEALKEYKGGITD